jgi:hypothetical protein
MHFSGSGVNRVMNQALGGCATSGTLLATAWAQDTRHVTEPKIPAACATLPGWRARM